MLDPSSPAQALGALALDIDHIAIAVPNLEESLALYVGLLGFRLRERRSTRGASTGMLSAVVEGAGVTVVLVQGTEPESQVSRFVAAHGAGVQHVAIRVSNLDAARRSLEERGLSFVTSTIHGPNTRQVLSARDSALGVRLELIERTETGFDAGGVEEMFRQLERQNLE
jgi:4-hydroxyphenylpyruvate dioxygenase-like putative hemolysin